MLTKPSSDENAEMTALFDVVRANFTSTSSSWLSGRKGVVDERGVEQFLLNIRENYNTPALRYYDEKYFLTRYTQWVGRSSDDPVQRSLAQNFLNHVLLTGIGGWYSRNDLFKVGGMLTSSAEADA